MEITNIKIFLSNNSPNSRIKAFVSITLDNVFVVHGIKIIEDKDDLFIAMPSKEIKQLCSKCNVKNNINSKFCNQCGSKLFFIRQEVNRRDVAYPVRRFFKEYMQDKILEAYRKECQKSNSR